MVLTYDAYSETLEGQREKESEVQILREKYQQDMKSMQEQIRNEMREQISQLLTRLKPEIIRQGMSE
jgi:F0F1-type ATP synthase membrane subunit b/b'